MRATLLEFTASPTSQYWKISDEAPKVSARLRQNPIVALELEIECGRRSNQAIEYLDIDYFVHVW